MSNPNKAKGTAFETAVYRYLQDAGIFTYKPRQEGRKDIGDIHAPPVVLQAKNYKDLLAALRDGVDGAAEQRVSAGMPYGFAVVKRARKPVEDAYVVMRLADLPELIRGLHEQE